MSRRASARAMLVAAALIGSLSPALATAGPYVVLFDPGSARLTPIAKRILDNFIEGWPRERNVQATIAGYADRTGSIGFNQRLSCARAAAVRTYLVARGLPSERMVSAGFGEKRPIVETPDEVAEMNNRRVEVVWGEAPIPAGGVSPIDESSEGYCPSPN